MSGAHDALRQAREWWDECAAREIAESQRLIRGLTNATDRLAEARAAIADLDRALAQLDAPAPMTPTKETTA